jgi:hypothetical protein
MLGWLYHLGRRASRARSRELLADFDLSEAGDHLVAMPPYAEWYCGREAVAGSWLMPEGAPLRLRYLPTRANGQLALGV